MGLDIQVLGVGSAEMAPSVIVTGESQRYLFNACEGLQRVCMEHRVRLGKLQTVLLTELTSETLGGLPGLILTISDIGKKGLRLCGPDGTSAFLHATRHFLNRPKFELKAHDIVSTSDAPLLTDENLTLDAVVVTTSRAATDDESSAKRQKVPTVTSVSYIGETPRQRGKFLIQKALALGVPKGPLCGALHRGEDVTVVVDGKSVVVTPAQCVEPSLPGAAFAVVACPGVSSIAPLLQARAFHKYQGGETDLAVLVHMGGIDVLSHPDYIAWTLTFGRRVQHILVNHTACPQRTPYRASAALQATLHGLFPATFPTSHHENDSTTSVDTEFGAAIVGEPLLKFTLVPVPKQGVDRASCFAPLDLAAVTAETQTMLREANVTLAPPSQRSSAACVQAGAVTFLGTGSAIPSKYRNVTSNLLRFGDAYLLLDAGEGTYGQLYRHVGGDEAALTALLTNLHVVWISHNHADHHLGLVRLLSRRPIELPPLAIVGPPHVLNWLRDYGAVDANINAKYMYESNGFFDVHGPSAKDQERFGSHEKAIRDILKQRYGVTSFECVPVQHCHLSYALVLTCANGFKVAFSGDCRPSDALVQYAEDADLLIHEATFEEGMLDEAKAKDHSTTDEAIGVGLKANAKYILLTHFSQRYPKMPTISAEALQRVMTALDLMSLSFDELHVPQLMQACQAILPGNDVADDE
ncbi:hypothetical protein SPRG_02608 [Saprolegnia parasitica CBS 223.65]|uniref:ribonuclease Z n=1 Tax=Saprolegnia parasitica (strain CBS 223.65) TaxID=695850 RepID=A0A067D2D3_SAPPC|nr:hypothetical protein SPRG_02608 [Saprolegnia parasitica CBS 223.65]KDO32916.1 hypothetical protein SPRG_02608 [Saprolegnia parasitica CBS 223.65]|eukprot:XP_012196564.1 hypothetical protein SPRG_02608 [Saprolegnia parasitica CBS 223.65]